MIKLPDRIRQMALPIPFTVFGYLMEEVLGIIKEMVIVLSFLPLLVGDMVYYPK